MREFQISIQAEEWAHEYVKSCFTSNFQESCSLLIDKMYFHSDDFYLYLGFDCSADDEFNNDYEILKASEKKITDFFYNLSSSPGVSGCFVLTNLFPDGISFWSSSFDETEKFQHHEVDCEAIPRFPIFCQTADTVKDENDPRKAD